MQRVYKDKRRRSIGQQPGTKSASRPAIKPLIKRGSTAHFVSPFVYIGFRLFVFLGRRSSDVFLMIWLVRGILVCWANSSVGIQFCSTPPVLPEPAVRPDRVKSLEQDTIGYGPAQDSA